MPGESVVYESKAKEEKQTVEISIFQQNRVAQLKRLFVFDTLFFTRTNDNKIIDCHCMYVCIDRGCLSWSSHGIGRPTVPEGGAHQKWVQCPNPAGTSGHVPRTLAHTCTLGVLSVTNFTLGS